ncbi:MAG: N-acetylmuramoyl-L-alanine amidase family protein [Hasllibacter sp.]
MRALLLALALLAGPAAAQDLTAGAAVEPAVTMASDRGRSTSVELGLTRAVPFRLSLLDAPLRLAVDLRGADLSALDRGALTRARSVGSVRVGRAGDGWPRLELVLERPMAVEAAAFAPGSGTGPRVLEIVLREAARDMLALTEAPAPAAAPPPPGARPVIVIDPGHGGVDPGALAGDLREADLVLSYARALKEELLRAGRFEVVLTREDDRFVPLRDRVAIAVDAGADVLLSLHADSLGEGQAAGARIYTFDPERQDDATARLVERHQREALIGGLDLRGEGDDVAAVLVDLASARARPRSERLAGALVDGLRAANVNLYGDPRAHGDFAVLRAAGVPAALVEVGFLTGDGAAALSDPLAIRRMARGLTEGLITWAAEDAATAGREMR